MSDLTELLHRFGLLGPTQQTNYGGLLGPDPNDAPMLRRSINIMPTHELGHQDPTGPQSDVVTTPEPPGPAGLLSQEDVTLKPPGGTDQQPAQQPHPGGILGALGSILSYPLNIIRDQSDAWAQSPIQRRMAMEEQANRLADALRVHKLQGQVDFGSPQAELAYRSDPQSYGHAVNSRLESRVISPNQQVEYQEGDGSIRSYGQDPNVPRPPPSPPPGFRWNAAGGLEPIPGGPADIDYVGRHATATRPPISYVEQRAAASRPSIEYLRQRATATHPSAGVRGAAARARAIPHGFVLE